MLDMRGAYKKEARGGETSEECRAFIVLVDVLFSFKGRRPELGDRRMRGLTWRVEQSVLQVLSVV